MLGRAIEALRSELPTLPGAACVDFRIGGLEIDGELPVETEEEKLTFLLDSDVYEIALGGREEPASDGRRVKVPVNGGGGLPTPLCALRLALTVCGTDALLQKIKSEAAAILDIGSAQLDPRVVKFASTYKLVFSLLNQDASSGGALLNWDVQPLLDRTLSQLSCSVSLNHDPPSHRRPPPTPPHLARTTAQLHDRDPDPVLCTTFYRLAPIRRRCDDRGGRPSRVRMRQNVAGG